MNTIEDNFIKDNIIIVCQKLDELNCICDKHINKI
jgi:hypothetical protein